MTMNHEDSAIGSVRQEMAQIAFGALIGAALMLYAGFGLNLRGLSGNPAAYNAALAAFTWTMKAGGVAMGASALLLYVGWRPVLAFDALLTALIGALMLGTGGVLLMYQDMQGLLNLVFGVMFLGAARRSWTVYSYSGGVSAPRRDMETEPAAGAAHASDQPVDPNIRQAAMDRLLSNKRREAAPAVDSPRDVLAAPVEPPRVKTRSEPKPVTPVRNSPAQRAPAKQDEPPPEGFLAQLGRDEE